MIQGSILNSFMHRKMAASSGIIASPDKSCLLVPPHFTKGKSNIKKEDVFSFVTADKIQLFENLATIEWNPILYQYSSGNFVGTMTIGPNQESLPLRGVLSATKDFNIRDLGWIAKIWIHNR